MFLLSTSASVTLGDDSHKVALVAQHTSETAFGKNPGIGANHHVQHLYSCHYVWHADAANYTHAANMHMDGNTGPWSRIPPQPLTSRWGYVAEAALHNLLLRTQKNGKGEDFCPSFFYDMFDKEKRPKKENPAEGSTWKVNTWDCLATAYMDPRIIVGIKFEAEYGELVILKLLKWNRARSRQNFRAGFRIMDIAERVHCEERPWWHGAANNWRLALPKTAAALVDCSEIDQEELETGLQNGTKAGKAEHDKLYGYLDEPFGVILFLFCCGRSGSFVRLVLDAFMRIGVLFPEDVTGVAEPTDDDLLDELSIKLGDDSFARATWAYWRHWKLDAASLVSSFVELSQNMETERDDDTTTYSFVRGEGLIAVELYEHARVAIAPLPSSCARVELLFSLRKQIEENNESKAMVDMMMMYMENTVNVLRDVRRARTKSWRTSGSHKETAEQVVHACEQMLALMKRYSWARMKELPGRRTLSGKLTAADRQVAQRHRDMLRVRREESRRVERTSEQWHERAIAFGERPTVQQAALRIVGAVTLFDRRFAVLREVGFAGSSSRSKAYWTTLAARVLWEESRRALPLLIGGARLRAADGTLARKRTSTRCGWHETERRPVTKTCLAEHIKAHVVAMFVGKEDKNKRDANRCELCTARNNGEPVFHFGSVACLLDAHSRYNFMLVALNLYGSDTQLAATTRARTAEGASANPGGPCRPTTPVPPLRQHFLRNPPPANRRDPFPIAFATAPGPPAGPAIETPLGHAPPPPPRETQRAPAARAPRALPPPPAPPPPGPLPVRRPPARQAPPAAAAAAAVDDDPYARKYHAGSRKRRRAPE